MLGVQIPPSPHDVYFSFENETKMKNRAHIETKEQRLKRLKSSPPVESIETLLNSIANFFSNEIQLTPNQYQTSLLFLGIHAVSLTISEAFFGKSGERGYRLFLEAFVDGKTEDKKFSMISNTLHNWRNILAHQWIGSLGHSIEYDYKMIEGWKNREEKLVINPRIYCESYLSAFSAGGRIWKYESTFTGDQLEMIKSRIIEKYEKK